MGVVYDFSEWQLNIDWAKVGAAYHAGQFDGVILRVQAGWTHLDTKYKEYVAGCKQYGIPFATYAYYKGLNDADSLKEAESAFTNTDPASLGFAVDIEEVTGGNLVTGGQAFVDYLHSKGMKNVGIYSGKNFYDVHNLAAINCDWRWVAAYGPNDGQQHTDPNENGETLWQFTSTAHLDGVTTNVDESVEKGFFFTPNTPVTVVVPPPPPPTPVVVTPVSSGRKLYLPAKNLNGTPDNSWTVYKLNCPPIKEPQNIAGHLNPAKFGGLTYDIIDDFGGCVYGIQTQSFGHVKIYAAPSTGAVVQGVAAPTPIAPAEVRHTVVSGDTVSALAVHYGSTVAQIKSWNNLDANYTIYVGKSIRVK
jgi:GH25 family lysozyme M1 (1,4-beta-N-acetylmuramidase)